MKSVLWFEFGTREVGTRRGERVFGLFMHELAAALGDGKGAGTAALYTGLDDCRQREGILPQEVQLYFLRE